MMIDCPSLRNALPPKAITAIFPVTDMLGLPVSHTLIAPKSGSRDAKNPAPISIGKIKAAIIVPHAEEFTDEVHSGDTIEVIAPVEIKKALVIKDGDEVAITLE